MDFLRDPAWGGIGIVVGAIFAIGGFWVSFYLYRRQVSQKRFSYEIKTFASLIGIRAEARDRLKILFDDKPVENAFLVEIRFINSGDVPILESDFHAPVSIFLGERSEILSSHIVARKPRNLQPVIRVEGGRVVLEPILLNQKDWLEIKILAVNCSDAPLVEGRIVGVPELLDVVSYTRPESFALWLATAMALLSAGPTSVAFSFAEFLEEFRGQIYRMKNR